MDSIIRQVREQQARERREERESEALRITAEALSTAKEANRIAMEQLNSARL